MFKKLTAADIKDALKNTTRQYLVGHLKLPQELDHIDDTNIEIGVTDYKEYTIEAPHWHKVAYEYQYMISGETKYAQKSLGGTAILFIKTPPGNDKVVVEVNDNVQKWLEKWD